MIETPGFADRLERERKRTVASGKFSGFPGIVENRAGEALENQLKGEVYTSAPINVRDMNATTVTQMLGMAKDFQAMTGEKLVLNDGYRSFAEQVDVRMRKGDKWTAVPGTSEHGYGSAFDVNTGQVSKLQEMGLLKKYGFELTATGEGWHIARRQDTQAGKADKRFASKEGSEAGIGADIADSVQKFFSSAGDRIKRTSQEAYAYAERVSSKAISAITPTFSNDASTVADLRLNQYKQLNAGLSTICQRIGDTAAESMWLDRLRAEGTNTYG